MLRLKEPDRPRWRMGSAPVVRIRTPPVVTCPAAGNIPRRLRVPKGEVTCGYEDFDLDARNVNLQPVAQDILIQHLHENQRYRLQDGSGIVQEKRPEDYLVRGLIDFDDISYDEHATLL